MLTVEATLPLGAPPAWAVLERRLFDVARSRRRALPRALHPAGRPADLARRAAGPDARRRRRLLRELLQLAAALPARRRRRPAAAGAAPVGRRHRASCTDLGLVQDEYERGYDQFHQSESYTLLLLPLPGRPDQPAHRRAGAPLRRPLPDETRGPNYDAERRLIRAPHNGSGGPRWGFMDGEPSLPRLVAGMAPLRPAVPRRARRHRYDDLRDPALAARMGAGDARAHGPGRRRGQPRRHQPGRQRLPAHRRRALPPLGGRVRRRLDRARPRQRRPAARQRRPLRPDRRVHRRQVVRRPLRLDLAARLLQHRHGRRTSPPPAPAADARPALPRPPRAQIDRVMALGEIARPAPERHEPARALGRPARRAAPRASETFLVPYRHGDQGWFDYQPLVADLPDRALGPLARRRRTGRASSALRAARAVRLAAGASRSAPRRTPATSSPGCASWPATTPTTPSRSCAPASGRSTGGSTRSAPTTPTCAAVHIHHWQQHNPVTTEALVQLTLGAPPARLQRRPAARPAALLRRRAPPARPAARRGRPGQPRRRGRLEVDLVNLSPHRGPAASSCRPAPSASTASSRPLHGRRVGRVPRRGRRLRAAGRPRDDPPPPRRRRAARGEAAAEPKDHAVAHDGALVRAPRC